MRDETSRPANALGFDRIESQAIDALPELRPAADAYWRFEGPEGEDSGAYVFFGEIVQKYIDILLAMETSSRRDELLRRAFAFIDRMLESDDEYVVTLAHIEIFEDRPDWWLASAAQFISTFADAALVRQESWRNRNDRNWRERAARGAKPSEAELREIRDFDMYGIRAVVEALIHDAAIDEQLGQAE